MNKLFSWVAVGLWMGLIFYLSHQPATESNQLSTSLTEIFLRAITASAPFVDVDVPAVHHLIRKAAHFFAYFILGMLVYHALSGRGIARYRNFVVALGICILYAISDEVHQLFVAGRSGEVRDVFIDSVGASVGILVYVSMQAYMSRAK